MTQVWVEDITRVFYSLVMSYCIFSGFNIFLTTFLKRNFILYRWTWRSGASETWNTFPEFMSLCHHRSSFLRRQCPTLIPWITSVSGLFPRIETKFWSQSQQQLCLVSKFVTHEAVVLSCFFYNTSSVSFCCLDCDCFCFFFMNMTTFAVDLDDSESTARLSSEGFSLSSLSLREDDGYPRQQLVSFSVTDT